VAVFRVHNSKMEIWCNLDINPKKDLFLHYLMTLFRLGTTVYGWWLLTTQ